jgi:hypothetical protein
MGRTQYQPYPPVARASPAGRGADGAGRTGGRRHGRPWRARALAH